MKSLDQLTKSLDQYYAKVPALPTNIKELIVTLAPWLALAGAFFAVLGAWSLYSVMTSPFVAMVARFGGVNNITWILSAVILVVTAVIYVMAFSPLRAKKVKGWNLMFYAIIVYVVSDIVTLSVGSIVMGVIGALIGYYFLYQVKSYYK